jgi:hypothetical protein
MRPRGNPTMAGSISEADWKYLQNIKGELLEAICRRINKKTVAIFRSTDKTDYEKYIAVYNHIKDSDDIVAECFNDWRRSTIGQRLISMQRHKLLTEKNLEKLSEKARKFVKWSETL